MKNVETQYKDLIQDLLLAPNKEDRTGTGTKSVFGRMLVHDMSEGFPLLTNKRVYYTQAIHELLWIAKGRTDMQYLWDNGVKYWDADYKRSGRSDETLGPVYGKQWRDFNGVDQLFNVLDGVRNDPSSRRMIVSAWNPADMPDMVLPPCHYGFQLYVNEGKVDLIWQQRSADVFLGLPYDIAMYGLLLEMIAKGNKLKAGKLIAQLGDCHLYNDHLKQARIYLSRVEPAPMPKLKLKRGMYSNMNNEVIIPEFDDIEIINYDPKPAIPAPLSVGK
jgi:thymidylate synthase